MSEQDNKLRTAILTTVVRFDIFDYPLTDFEIWQYLEIKVSYQAVRTELEKNTYLRYFNGFYFLPGREKIIQIRHTRYREAQTKIKTTHKLIRLIIWFPWIRLLCLANVIGAHNLKKEADLDLLIITKKNRLWLTKLLATTISALARVRPTKNKTKNRLCLSFLIDDSALDLHSCRYNDQDWYFAYWLTGLMPLFGSINVYGELLKANPWLHELLPNWRLANPKPHNRLTQRRRSDRVFNIFDFLEKFSKKIHQNLLGTSLREQQNRNTAVIITDHLLKLHTIDRRPDFFALADKQLKNINL